jgi:tRNA 2-thiouridine synthesizing protein E
MNNDITLEYTDFINHFLEAHPEVIEDQRVSMDSYWTLPPEHHVPLKDMIPSVVASRPAADGPAFDTDGFLADTATWSLGLARRMAAMDGLGDLDETQISLLSILRDHFRRHGAVPAIPHVCHLNGLGPDCLSRRFTSPRQAWRIAGLPNPGEEAKAYL